MPLFLIGFFLFPEALQAKSLKLCGQNSVQTVWSMSPAKTQLKFKAMYRHKNSPFCEISVDPHNAEIVLLDGKKNLVRKLKTYLPLELSQDFFNGEKLSGTTESQENVPVQLRFVDDEKFKTVKFVKIVQPDGKVYGPVAL